MPLDIGFDTVVLLIATMIQSDKMHISAQNNQMSQFTNIE